MDRDKNVVYAFNPTKNNYIAYDFILVADEHGCGQGGGLVMLVKDSFYQLQNI